MVVRELAEGRRSESYGAQAELAGEGSRRSALIAQIWATAVTLALDASTATRVALIAPVSSVGGYDGSSGGQI
ncbi:hornerin-like [Iris pallida]|uniref:Hornerin-like n=1 Tax=Iris pallida TaxID=29817 RepID=A0AAX6FJY2_IRIPA|nr:hornerin-like [Iris pallida]